MSRLASRDNRDAGVAERTGRTAEGEAGFVAFDTQRLDERDSGKGIGTDTPCCVCLFLSAEDDLQNETKAASTLDAITRDWVECNVMLVNWTGAAAA